MPIKSIFQYISVFCFVICAMVHQAKALDVVYPHPPTAFDGRADYALRVLELTLQKTEQEFGPWSVSFSDDPLERPQMEDAVIEGQVAQVIMLPGTNENDLNFRLIPFPIDKGLIGYRISLVNRNNRNLFHSKINLNEIEEYIACVGEGWNITNIFEYNKLNVSRIARFEDLFRRLNDGQCDYFSRGVGEVLSEFGFWSQTYANIAIEPHTMMRTPLAFYLYVNIEEEELARRIELGLRRAILDGSFEQLFQQEFAESIRALRLLGRTVFDLTPLEVHEMAPTEDKGLWFKP